jgi:hypothetical protein
MWPALNHAQSRTLTPRVAMGGPSAALFASFDASQESIVTVAQDNY